MSSVLWEAPWSDAPVLRKKAMVTIAVIETAAPATKAAELCRQFLLVARKIALRICGPAIITNASGRTFAKFHPRTPFSGHTWPGAGRRRPSDMDTPGAARPATVSSHIRNRDP